MLPRIFDPFSYKSDNTSACQNNQVFEPCNLNRGNFTPTCKLNQTLHVHAAIDMDGSTCYVGCFWSGQETDCIGYFVGLAKTT